MNKALRLLLLFSASLAALGRYPASPSSVACAGLDNGWSLGAASIFSNPWGLSRDTAWSAGLSVLHYWRIPNLYQGDASLQVPVLGLHAGLGCSVLRLDSLYQENDYRAAVAFARRAFSAGAAVSVLQSRFSADDQDFSFSTTWGGRFALPSGFSLSLNVERLFATAPFESPGGLGPLVSVAAAYSWGRLFRAGLEWEKAGRAPFSLTVGQELTVARHFIVRCGFRSDPLFFALGIGLCFREMEVDAGMLSHSGLGLLRSFGLVLGPRSF